MDETSTNSRGTGDLVSIVIPAYRADAYLPETLESVSSQTWLNWELILVEDGSHCETETILGDFAARHPDKRVVYHNTERNVGQGHARNVAISLSRGQLIAFLDADDIWLPCHLSSKVDVLQSSNADIAYSSSSLFDDETGEVTGVWGPDNDTSPGNVQLALALRSFLTPSATLARRKMIEKIGGFDESDLFRNVEDYDFWLRAAASGARFMYVPGEHCRYRKGHDEAATRNLERLNYKLALVLEKNIGALSDLDSRVRAKLLARRLFIAGVHNIRANTPFAQIALRRAWRLHKGRPSYAVVSLASYFPQLLYFLRVIVRPLQRLIRVNPH